MFYGDKVEDTRQMYYDSWQKYLNKEPLSALEQQIVAVIADHPEYQPLFSRTTYLYQAYFPEAGETNPFLHMGLHLAIREQVSLDRPTGIQAIYQRLLAKAGNALAIEHRMMDCLAEILWQAQRDNKLPDENAYLLLLQSL